MIDTIRSVVKKSLSSALKESLSSDDDKALLDQCVDPSVVGQELKDKCSTLCTTIYQGSSGDTVEEVIEDKADVAIEPEEVDELEPDAGAISDAPIVDEDILWSPVSTEEDPNDAADEVVADTADPKAM